MLAWLPSYCVLYYDIAGGKTVHFTGLELSVYSSIMFNYFRRKHTRWLKDTKYIEKENLREGSNLEEERSF